MTGEPEKDCLRKGHSSADQGSAEEGVRHRGQEEQCSRQRDPELTLRDAKSKGERSSGAEMGGWGDGRDEVRVGRGGRGSFFSPLDFPIAGNITIILLVHWA